MENPPQSDPQAEAMVRLVEIHRCAGDDCRADSDALAVEEPLEIRLNGTSAAITMRSPGADEALAAGFAATEGIVRVPEDIYDITRCAEPEHPDQRNVVTVYLRPELLDAAAATGRQRYATSGCGLCGRASIEAIRSSAPRFAGSPALSRAVLRSLPDRLRAAQPAFEHTGGLHAAGLFEITGAPICVAEDIGRHNAVDKVIGRALLDGRWPLNDTVLMVSGRAGFEIVQKALAARVPAVCSVSAPSSLAAELARESNMILIGFLRGARMNVYAGFERLQD